MIAPRPSDGASPALEVAAGRFPTWLADNRALFGFQRATHPIRQLDLLKPFAEFVLCNDLLLSYGATDAVLMDNLGWAWEETEAGDYLVRLLMARPDISRLASVYAPLHRRGFRNARLDIALRNVTLMRGTGAAEMQPWMRLGFHHAMAQITGDRYDPLAVPGTWLLAKPEPWCMNDDIAYSMTHEVFYATDFGRSACAFPDGVRRYLELWLPAWTAPYVEDGNWDLTAEMVMVADCIGGVTWEHDPLPTLLAHQGADGMVPGPPGGGRLLCDGSETATEAAFFANYHTTLVASIATWLRMSRPMHHPSSDLQPRVLDSSSMTPALSLLMRDE